MNFGTNRGAPRAGAGGLTDLNRTVIVLFMAANSLLAGAVQILSVLAWRDGKDTTSEILAGSLRTNPVVVRRIVKALERQGLVEVRPGRHGGVALAKSPADITLEDIYKAVEPGGALFALRERGSPRCPVHLAMKELLPPLFGAADAAVDKVLRQTKLATLVAQIP
jgi:DNA-binding IscR family transcriptional regulator